MKLTNKQRQEVEYLKTWSKIPVSDESVEEYINITVNGLNRGGKFSDNPLVQAQQRLGVTLSLWKEDMVKGLVSFDELMEEASCDYEKSLITSVRDSVTAKYRRQNLKENDGTVLSFTNFPEVMKFLTKKL